MAVNFNDILDLSNGQNDTKKEILEEISVKSSQNRLDTIDNILTQHMGVNYKFYLFLMYFFVILLVILIIYGF